MQLDISHWQTTKVEFQALAPQLQATTHTQLQSTTMEVLSHEVTFFAHKEEFFGALQALLALPDDDASTGAAKELVDKVADIVRTHRSRKLRPHCMPVTLPLSIPHTAGQVPGAATAP